MVMAANERILSTFFNFRRGSIVEIVITETGQCESFGGIPLHHTLPSISLSSLDLEDY